MILYLYRTAIGDLEAPNGKYWAIINNNNQHQTFIIYTIWAVWMIEQYFMLIVSLNFLIAIIS